MVSVAVLLASLAVLANAKLSLRSALVVHETRNEVPSGFARSGTPSPETPLQLRIAIAERDTKGLQNALMEVSTPGNAKYGQHLSKEEVRTPIQLPWYEFLTQVLDRWRNSSGLRRNPLMP